jgi:MarR family transcriptional regulator, lower aerobic nicotinate degradation pathway regulator
MNKSTNSTDLKTLEEFGQVRRNLNLLFTNALRPLGLGVKQALILRFLSKRGKASLAELSRDTFTDPAGMTRVITVLMKQGVLCQKEHATDKRRWEMALTPQGKKIAADLEKLYLSLSEKVFKGISTAEKNQFSKTLQKLSGGLQK